LLSSFETIDRYSLDGEYIDTIYEGNYSTDSGLCDLAVDDEKNIYVSDTANGKIYRLKKVN